MRCARCDRPTVPQAVGLTEDGRVVFGWCVHCLDETGCRDVKVARPPKRPSLVLDLRPSRWPWQEGLTRRSGPAGRRATGADVRSRALGTFAVALGAWGGALFLAGAGVAVRSGLYKGNALGQGSPVLMMFGGGMTVALATTLGALVRPRADARPGPVRWLKVAQGVAFLVAVGVLVVGIARHDPRRDVLVVGLTSLALSVSVAARWWELRSSRVPAG